MTSMGKLWVAGAAGIAALAFAASVQAQGRRDPDLNGDGRISRDEYVSSSVAAMMAYDGDGDGKVMRTELPALARTPLGKSFVDRVWLTTDLNRDAGIVRTEVESASRSFFARADTNGDGYLSRAEIEAARKAERARRDGGR